MSNETGVIFALQDRLPKGSDLAALQSRYEKEYFQHARAVGRNVIFEMVEQAHNAIRSISVASPRYASAFAKLKQHPESSCLTWLKDVDFPTVSLIPIVKVSINHKTTPANLKPILKNPGDATETLFLGIMYWNIAVRWVLKKVEEHLRACFWPDDKYLGIDAPPEEKTDPRCAKDGTGPCKVHKERFSLTAVAKAPYGMVNLNNRSQVCTSLGALKDAVQGLDLKDPEDYLCFWRLGPNFPMEKMKN